MKKITVFEIYDKNNKYMGFYLHDEETKAATRAKAIGGRYQKSYRVVGK